MFVLTKRRRTYRVNKLCEAETHSLITALVLCSLFPQTFVLVSILYIKTHKQTADHCFANVFKAMTLTTVVSDFVDQFAFLRRQKMFFVTTYLF